MTKTLNIKASVNYHLFTLSNAGKPLNDLNNA